MYFNLNIWKKTTKQNKTRTNKPVEALKANTIPIQLGDFIIHCLPLKLLNTHTHLLQCQKFIGSVWNKHLASLRATDRLCSPDSIWQHSPDKSSSSILLSEGTQFAAMKNIWHYLCWYILCLKSSDSRRRQHCSLCLTGNKVQLINKDF